MKLGGGKTWFTAAELAELALPGLSKAKRKINERAQAEAWSLRNGEDGTPLARPRQGRGGGMEYHVSLLPAAARSALAQRGVAIVADVRPEPITTAAQMWRWYEAQSDKVKLTAEHRLTVIQFVEQIDASGFTRSYAVTTACKKFGVGASTLWGWLGLVDGITRADWLAYLAPRHSGGGAEAQIDPQAWQIFLSDYLRPEKRPLAECVREARAWADRNGIELPHARAFERKLKREIDERVIVKARMGEEALRRTLPSQQRSVLDLHALEAVNIDGHRFDVFVHWEDGTIGRPMMIAIQDVFSRKMLAWRLARSENSLDTRVVIGQLLRNWGVPKHFLLDNGRAFASKWITGGAKTRFRFKVKDTDPLGVLTALGINIHWATPFRGQSKPIERAFRDLTNIIAKHPETSGAYTGNRPDAKPENYGTAAVPIEQFRRLVDRGIAAHNSREGRRTETAHGRYSFDQVFEMSAAAAPIGKATPEQLRLALLTAEECRLDRKTAEVRLEGNRYWTPELADHRGEKVMLRFDPDDLHSEVHVYARDGKFIATAPVLEKAGFFDKASAAKRRAQEADLRRTIREKEKLEDLLVAADLAKLLDDGDAPEPAPIETPIVRPVRHRGQTAAALKPLSEAAQAPLSTPVIDRIGAALRVIDGGL